MFAAGAIGPDIALLVGFGRGLAPGQLRPGAVPLYNALHSFAAPAAVAVAGAFLGTAWLVLAAAWGTHIAIDRACGFGQRDRDGFQRA